MLDQTARAQKLGVRVTIIAVMMRTNFDKLPEIGALAARHGANFRVNVYQAVKTDAFSLDYEQFWSGFQKPVESCPLAVSNEPIVRTILRFDAASDGCGKGTIRVTPKGDVLPSVFWPRRNLGLAELENLGAGNAKSPAFRELDRIPQFCGSRRFVESCRGGYPNRRLLRGGLDQPDEFCPFAAGKLLPSFPSLAGSSRQFPKAGSACTTVFGAEEQGEPKGMSNSKLPALDPARVLVILRVALGALFVSTFFENLGKGLYGAEGYAGLIRGYIQNGHAPAVWKQVMEFTAAHAAVAGPLQALLEASLGVLLILGLFTRPAALVAFGLLSGLWVSEWGTAWIWELLVPMVVAAALALGPSGRHAAVDVALARRWPELPIW